MHRHHTAEGKLLNRLQTLSLPKSPSNCHSPCVSPSPHAVVMFCPPFVPLKASAPAAAVPDRLPYIKSPVANMGWTEAQSKSVGRDQLKSPASSGAAPSMLGCWELEGGYSVAEKEEVCLSSARRPVEGGPGEGSRLVGGVSSHALPELPVEAGSDAGDGLALSPSDLSRRRRMACKTPKAALASGLRPDMASKRSTAHWKCWRAG